MMINRCGLKRALVGDCLPMILQLWALLGISRKMIAISKHFKGLHAVTISQALDFSPISSYDLGEKNDHWEKGIQRNETIRLFQISRENMG